MERKMQITACFIIFHVLSHQLCHSGRSQIILTRPRLRSQPTTCDDASQERGREPIKELTEDDERMKADEKGGLKNDRQRQRAPDGDSEEQTAVKSGSQNCDVEAHDECE